MINVSDATKQAFLTSSTQKTIYIEFPNKNMVLSNEDIVSESFELKQALEDERNLTFKGCIASQVKFQAAEIAEDLRGELMTVSIQAGNTETIKLFTGYVESQSNLTQEDFVTNIVAYDAFYKIGNITIEDFGHNYSDGTRYYRFEFYSGVGQDDMFDILHYLDLHFGLLGYYDNYDYYNRLLRETRNAYVLEVREYPYLGMAEFRAANGSVKLIDVMRYLCQSIGVYGYIDGNGLLNFKKLEPFNKATYPGQNTIPANDLYPAGENTEIIFEQSDYFEAKYEPYDVNKIDGIKLHTSSEKTDLYPYPEPVPTNPFTFGDSSFGVLDEGNTEQWQYANQRLLLKRIKEIWYKPSMISVAGRPWFELGDSYIYTTRKNIVRSYILKRTLKGIQSLLDTYEAEGEEKRDSDIYQTGSGPNVTASSLNVDGHTVTFKDITISGTTYHLLGYTD